MKKIIYILAAMVAMAACSKENPAEESGTGTSSNKGRMVTISVSAPEGSTKVVGTDNGDSFSFKWEEGDKILVACPVFGSKSEFTLVTGAGTKNATFTGIMPEGYEFFEFYIQYPYTPLGIKTQTYEAGKIPVKYMIFKADGLTTIDKPVTLSPQYAILQLNLYGLARSVKEIKVRDAVAQEDISTLTCSTPVTVGKDKDHATPFYIVYNGASNVKLQIDVTMEEGTPEASDLPDYLTYGKAYPISCKTFVQNSAKEIAAGTCVNMPAISLTTNWAPVNCGYDPDNFKYGKLYQWGRKDGSGYIDYYAQEHELTCPYDDAGGILQNSPNPGSITDQIEASDEKSNYYYNTTYIVKEGADVSYNTDWLKTPNNYRWDANGGSEAAHVAQKTQYDPCPEGWRVPTKAEMATLMGGNSSKAEFPISTHGSTTGIAGRWFNGSDSTTHTTGVFLPVVGYRNSLNTAACASRQTVSASYWTSSVSDTLAYTLGFGRSATPSIVKNNRASGFAVRCVQE